MTSQIARERFRDLQGRVLDHYGTKAESNFTELDRPPLRTHYLEAGAGNPVVLVHGGGGMAVQLEPLLSRLQDRFHLYAPDRPGCGLTDPFAYTGVDLRRHAEEFLGSFLDAVDLERAALVAGSIGGLWAMFYALARPGRVERLVLVGSPAGLTTSVPLPLRIMGTPVGTLLMKTVMDFSKPSNVRRSLEDFAVTSDDLPEVVVECHLAAAAIPGADVAFRTMVQEVISLRGFRERYVVTDELRQLEVPTLFLWGEEDDVYPPSLGEEVAPTMPEARVERVPRAGHYLWMDAPDWTAELITGFLGRGP